MALLKDIKIPYNDMTLSYHVVTYYDVNITRSLLTVTISSYISESDYIIEREAVLLKSEQEQIRLEIGIEQRKDKPDEEKIAFLQSQLVSIPEIPNKCYYKETFGFHYDKNIVMNLSMVYELIKEHEMFKDAKDLITTQS